MRLDAKAAVLLVVGAVGLVLAACSANETRTPVYLTEEIPPCTPVDGVADRDPCEYGSGHWGGMGGLASAGPLDHGPSSIAWHIGDNEIAGLGTAHVVVRASYLPDTVRCTAKETERHPTWLGWDDWHRDNVMCFMDVRVNSYIYGSGPPVLTIVIYHWMGSDSARVEAGFVNSPRIGREEILFLGATLDFGVAAYQPLDHRNWRLEQREDGTVLAVHPYRGNWLHASETHRPAVEMTLEDFKTRVAAAYTAMLAKFNGKVADVEGAPATQPDANKLQDFYVAAGAMEHPDGPPGQPPPPCGLAVPDQANNPGLMLDCFALLEGLDELRGTGTLNWSVDEAIADWDGITTGSTPSRVTKLELDDEDLTGSIPVELTKLTALEELRLSGNSLTGCVPPALRSVATNDLDDLGLPDCG